MHQTRQATTERLYYLDNIRYFLVLLVVVLHAACAYSNYLPWWPVNDKNASFFDGWLRLMDIFLMPGLFFIAGYFALPSLIKERYQTWGFIRKKLLRLGIPWLIGVTLLGPVRLSIFQYTRFTRYDFWDNVVTLNRSAISFYTGIIDSSYQFTHLYFWFISLLLLFFIFFALVHKSWQTLTGHSSSDNRVSDPTGASILVALLCVGLASAVITFFIHGLFANSANKSPWLLIGNLIQFQPTKITLYVLNFGVGIYAYHKRWFFNGKVPGHFVLWLTLSVVLYLVWEAAFASIVQSFSMKMGIVLVFTRPLLHFSILLTLLAFGVKYWQNRSKINRTLSENSYTIYIVHMLFVWFMQLALVGFWDVSIYLKFFVVALSSALLSWAASHYLIRNVANHLLNSGRP